MKRLSCFGLLVLVCSGMLVLRADAGLTPELASTILERMRVVVLPQGEQGVRLDGFLTLDGKQPTVETEAHLSWNDSGLTVVFDCQDDEIKAEKRERDAVNIWQDDSVEVFLDKGRQRDKVSRDWYHIIVNAAGVEYDERGPVNFTSIGHPENADRSWDMQGLKTEVTHTDAGWTAKLFIPWDDLGGKPAPGEVWGFNLMRVNWPESEFLCFSPTHGPFYNIDKWATLVFADKPLEEDMGILAPLFDALGVMSAPRGVDGVIEGLPTILNTPPSSKTRLASRWDENGLTLTVDCEDDNVRAGERERNDIDNLWRDDGIEVFLDVGNQRRHDSDQWFHLALNAAGSVGDQRGPMKFWPQEHSHPHTGLQPATPRGGNPGWNMEGLKTQVEKTDDGWRAELFIPWAGLGVEAPDVGDVWGFNLARNDHPGGDSWRSGAEIHCLMPTISFLHYIDRWGHLVFVDQPVELTPSESLPGMPSPRSRRAPKTGENLVPNGYLTEGGKHWTMIRAANWNEKGNPVDLYHPTDHHFIANWDDIRQETHPETREHVLRLGGYEYQRVSAYTRAQSQPFPIDPAYRYRFSLKAKTVSWDGRFFVDGYRWRPGVRPHRRVPKPEELQRVWRSQPIYITKQAARHMRQQNYAVPVGTWAEGSTHLPFEEGHGSVFDLRAWSQVEFLRVYLDSPGHPAGPRIGGIIDVADIVVERVE